MTIGGRIRDTLEKSGKKPAELAKFLGTGQSTISGWCKEGKVPASDKILPICEFLEVSIGWLLSGEDQFDKNLTPDQREILSLWDRLDPINKAEVRGYIRAKAEK